MSGLADYLAIPTCPYPPIVQEWESIPSGQVASFAPEGFQAGDCFAGLGDYIPGWGVGLQQLAPGGRGLGDIALTAPGGYFASGIDFTQWGALEWLSTLGGVWILFSTFWTTKSAVSYAKEGVKRSKSKRKRLKAAKESRGFF